MQRQRLVVAGEGNEDGGGGGVRGSLIFYIFTNIWDVAGGGLFLQWLVVRDRRMRTPLPQEHGILFSKAGGTMMVHEVILRG